MKRESDKSEPSWMDAVLAEYEAHRAEVLAQGAAQQQHLALGATAVGVVVAGAFNVWDDRLLATIAFLAAVPLLSVLVLVQWAGSAAAMMRVGVYLERLEAALKASTSAPEPLLTWETTIANMRPDKRWKPKAGWSDVGAVATFALIAAGSLALGGYRGWSGQKVFVGVLTGIESLALVVIVLAIGYGVATVRRQARHDFPPTKVDPQAGNDVPQREVDPQR